MQKKTRKILAPFYGIFLFLICTILLTFLFPKEPKFKFDFTLGSPWMYSDLIADFDFPIYKTDEQITKERDSVINNFISFYYYDTIIQNVVITNLEKEINYVGIEIVEKLSSKGFEVLTAYRLKNQYKNLEYALLKELHNMYQIGVYSKDEYINQNDIYIVENDIFELVSLSELISVENAKLDMISLLKSSKFYAEDSSLTLNYFEDIISSNIIPNIIYNEEISDQILNNNLSSLSVTTGIVQNGELIILRGSIVDENTYQILYSLKKSFENNLVQSNFVLITTGIALLLLVLFIGLFLYYKFYQKSIFFSFKNVTYIFAQIIIIIILTIIIIKYTEIPIHVIPFCLFALLIISFFNFHTALLTYFASIMMLGFFVPDSFEFIFIQLCTGIFALFSMRNIQKRRQIFISVVVVFISYASLHTSFHLMKNLDIAQLDYRDYLYYAGSSFMLLLYLPFVYIYEKIFGFVSDFSLMELSDTNNQALRRLAERAPGTFQHTLQVANLTESVVRELKGNALLARTGALYHDIGKVANPDFFIENQSGTNIHTTFDYEESAEKIIQHVTKGLELAKKYKLPQQITDFICMHHGTGITKYFYNSYVNKNPGIKPDKSKFTYPGPKPQNIETAVMMMADAIEAAARTLKSYNNQTITELVDNIINSQLNDNQYSDVDITLKQITKAKKIFVEKIKNIYHSRIDYPGIK